MVAPLELNSDDHNTHSRAVDAGDASHTAVASRWRLAFGAVFGPVWSSGAVLAVCMFLPIFMSQGCGTKHPEYPYEWFQEVHSTSEAFIIQFRIWPYLFGLLAAGGTLWIAIAQSPRHFRMLWTIYACMIIVVVLGLWCTLGKQFRENNRSPGIEAWMEQIWVLGPTTLLLATLFLTYRNCHTWFSAAMWVQLMLSVVALAWFIFVVCVVRDDLLIGGKLSIAASAVLLAGTAWERLHGLEALGVSLSHRRVVPPLSSVSPIPRFTNNA